MAVQGDYGPPGHHVAFQGGYIWAALVMAFGVGFAIGAHLVFVIGFGLPLGRGYASFIQAHGHVQLLGWAGLVIVGISLHFLPRLASVPLIGAPWLRVILWLMISGLGLRSLAQTVGPYLTDSWLFIPCIWLVAASGLCEWGGVALYISLLVRTLYGSSARARRGALSAIRPYLGMMLIGWGLYASLNLVLVGRMAWDWSVVVPQAWNQLAIQGFIGLVLLPVAFAVSVRTFPLYLRLAVPEREGRTIAQLYAAALTLQLLSLFPPLLRLYPQAASFLASLGMLGKGGVILWFVWHLDILTRRRAPWTVRRRLHPGPDRRPTRPGIPDYGEFGRFERLIHAAYVWLVLAACSEALSGLAALFGQPFIAPPDALRHMYVLGFISLLIFGMSVRMIPGFLAKRRVASTTLVDATYWCGNAAAVGRILLVLAPEAILDAMPGGREAARAAFAISGILGLIAVLCLAINLGKTATRTL